MEKKNGCAASRAVNPLCVGWVSSLCTVVHKEVCVSV